MYTEQQRETMRQIAYDSIEHGLSQGTALDIDATDYDEALQQHRASFVTLKIGDALRGCIGVLLPQRPLIEDVAHNAYSAAFHDRRFDHLHQSELEKISIHISVLNEPEALSCTSEKDLLQKLNKGRDGIILSRGELRATFLPSVWESIDDEAEFIQQLKLKAGLPAHYWSDQIRIERYTVEEF